MSPHFKRPTSYYRATVENDWVIRDLLDGRQHAQVAIVGAGFAGLSTALQLLENGVRDVVVIEAGEIGQGASGRNGGFVFGGYSLSEGTLVSRSGANDAKHLYQLTLDAVNLIRERATSGVIDCQVNDAGVVWANWFRNPRRVTDRRDLLASQFGVQWDELDATQLRAFVRSDHYSNGMLERNAFHFHPLRYAASLAQRIESLGGRVYTHSPVTALERDAQQRWCITTPAGRINADQVVLCGGGYHHLGRRVAAAMMPISTYVMVTEPLGERLDALLPGAAAVYDSRFAFDYYRKLSDGRLLWGGRISVADPSAEKATHLLRRDLARVFPSLADARVDYAWSGLMSYARHQMPQLTRTDDGLWVAQAFGGHGVATTTVGGRVMGSAVAAFLSDSPMPEDWNRFSRYGLSSSFKPLGLVAAQLSYWYAQTADALRVFRRG